MNKLFHVIILFLLIAASSCKPEVPVAISDSELSSHIIEQDDDIIIALGSCNKQDSPQIMWDDIINEAPDMWIWLGDNIYGDSEDPAVLSAKYEKQLQNQEYQTLLRGTKIVGTWDDHDYGKNNAGKELKSKKVSRDLLFNFLDVDKSHSAWKREGAYIAHDLVKEGIKVKVILLDSRYFRDAAPMKNKRYLKPEGADVLGEAQWLWLDSLLTNSDADIHLIGNGIQVIAEDHRFEKWANFPSARHRLFELISTKKISRPVLMSGDRHLSELSAIQVDGLELPLYDITSSGLTHSYRGFSGEENQHRIGEVIPEKSYAVLAINKSGVDSIKVELRFMGDGQKLFQKFQLFPS